MSRNKIEDYHQLLARHHAMRLRDQILSPGQQPRPPATGGPYVGGHGADPTADQQLIMQSLPLVAPLDAVIEGLYKAMFIRRPYLRSLFPESMDFQRDRLAQSLIYLIEHLNRPEEVRETFERLGRDHRKLGVWPVHYETFQASLRESLRRRGRQQWTAEMEQAWMRMLAFALDAMMGGAEAARAEPPYWHAAVVGHERRGRDLAVLRLRPNEPYPYEAGQYGALESPLLPHTWRHYSMAGAPRPDGLLEFHIRRTHQGGVSDALVTRTQVGDTLRLGPAHGGMTLSAELDDELDRGLLLVAGGTGLAPLKAIVEELALRRRGLQDVHLFVGARNRDELYDWDALVELDKRCPRLTVVPVLSEEPWYPGETGIVVDALDRYGDWSNRLAFVSGPPEMVGATVTRLQERNTPIEQIRYDPIPGALSA